jgi:hypothetical protein
MSEADAGGPYFPDDPHVGILLLLADSSSQAVPISVAADTADLLRPAVEEKTERGIEAEETESQGLIDGVGDSAAVPQFDSRGV